MVELASIPSASDHGEVCRAHVMEVDMLDDYPGQISATGKPAISLGAVIAVSVQALALDFHTQELDSGTCSIDESITTIAAVRGCGRAGGIVPLESAV